MIWDLLAFFTILPIILMMGLGIYCVGSLFK